MLSLFYFIENKKEVSRYLPTSKLSLFHLDQSEFSLKPMESCSYPRINYYSQQVVHGYLFAQIFGPVPLMLTLPII